MEWIRNMNRLTKKIKRFITSIAINLPGVHKMRNEPMNMTATYPDDVTALYGRLSQEEELSGDSNSIVHQKSMLLKYAQEHGFPNPAFFIGDSVDSAKGDNDFTPFRNLINNFFARDTSKKIRAVLKAKGNAEKHIGSPPYGYRLDPANEEKWLIDEEPAAIVKRIRNAPERHLVFKDTQEPIIDEKVFERVQELLAGKRRGMYGTLYP